MYTLQRWTGRYIGGQFQHTILDIDTVYIDNVYITKMDREVYRWTTPAYHPGHRYSIHRWTESYIGGQLQHTILDIDKVYIDNVYITKMDSFYHTILDIDNVYLQLHG